MCINFTTNLRFKKAKNNLFKKRKMKKRKCKEEKVFNPKND